MPGCSQTRMNLYTAYILLVHSNDCHGACRSMVVAGGAYIAGALCQALSWNTYAPLFLGRVLWGIGESSRHGSDFIIRAGVWHLPCPSTQLMASQAPGFGLEALLMQHCGSVGMLHVQVVRPAAEESLSADAVCVCNFCGKVQTRIRQLSLKHCIWP